VRSVRLGDCPEGSSEILATGTSIATVNALVSARQAMTEWDVEAGELGVRGEALRVYTANVPHSCVKTALRLLGFGRQARGSIPPDDAGRIDASALPERVAADRVEEVRPFCVVRRTGTVDVDTIGDLEALADFFDREEPWFHGAGAFRALVRRSPALAQKVAGIERADSLAFHFHEWLHFTYDCGCVLVGSRETHRAASGGRPRYLEGQPEGLAAREHWFCECGPELSREFRDLRVWFLLVEQGIDALAPAIKGSVEQARHLAARADAEPALERVARWSCRWSTSGSGPWRARTETSSARRWWRSSRSGASQPPTPPASAATSSFAAAS
jgi:glutamate/tyrosine decarboxylase-like PLP-dependent enzyme